MKHCEVGWGCSVKGSRRITVRLMMQGTMLWECKFRWCFYAELYEVVIGFMVTSAGGRRDADVSSRTLELTEWRNVGFMYTPPLVLVRTS